MQKTLNSLISCFLNRNFLIQEDYLIFIGWEALTLIAKL